MDGKDEQNTREIHSAANLQSSGLGLARFWGWFSAGGELMPKVLGLIRLEV